MIDAIMIHGPVRGVWLGAKRHPAVPAALQGRVRLRDGAAEELAARPSRRTPGRLSCDRESLRNATYRAGRRSWRPYQSSPVNSGRDCIASWANFSALALVVFFFCSS